MDRDLSATDYLYVWADGVHLRIRLALSGLYGRFRAPTDGR